MRFKVIGTVTWSIESDSLENAQELANQEIGKLPKEFDLRLLRLDKLKDKIEKSDWENFRWTRFFHILLRKR